MSIQNIDVVVPITGDGPPTNISSLVGSKTILLHGNFTGSLLGSDSGGEIQQTIPGSVLSVRLRALRPTPPSTTCSIAGLQGSLNNF